MEAQAQIAELVKRARIAQKVAESYSQERVLELARALAWVTVHNAEKWAQQNFEETGMGDVPSKIARINNRPRGVLRDLLTAKTVGVIEEDKEKGLIKIAKPVGVVGALVPMTVPVATPVIKGMNAIMGRNAIIFSPHPASKKISYDVVEKMRDVLGSMGAPRDLIICVQNPAKELSAELMRQCDLVIATGGSAMVKAAYSSGTPAYGVGVGNVVSFIDETANIADTARMIKESQLNDLATGCSTENSVIIHKSIYDEMLNAFKKQGAYLCNSKEKARLQSVLWKSPGILNNNIICRPAKTIGDAAGINMPEDTTFILVEEEGVGDDFPFSNEKLSVVVTVYKGDSLDHAIQKTNEIQAYKGAGHSCGIHSKNEDNIMRFATETYTSRVMVNQAQNKGNAGNFNNGMPFTISLGCGTWGGNITNENITYKHYINTTWVAWAIKGEEPKDDELFGDIMMNKALTKHFS